MAKNLSELATVIQEYLDFGIAPAIRIVTTFHEAATVHEMIAAGAELNLNASTVRKQFGVARRQDREFDDPACAKAYRVLCRR